MDDARINVRKRTIRGLETWEMGDVQRINPLGN
jgi:hypothetical protein